MAHGEERRTISSFADFANFVENEIAQDAIFRGHAKRSWRLIQISIEMEP